jgi:hypothetical protein
MPAAVWSTVGLTGSLEVWGSEKYPRGIVRDVVKGEKLRVVETDDRGPLLARYVPHPHDIDGQAEQDLAA